MNDFNEIKTATNTLFCVVSHYANGMSFLKIIDEAAERMANRIAELEEANCNNCKFKNESGNCFDFDYCEKGMWGNPERTDDSDLRTSAMKCSEWEAKSGSE